MKFIRQVQVCQPSPPAGSRTFEESSARSCQHHQHHFGFVLSRNQKKSRSYHQTRLTVSVERRLPRNPVLNFSNVGKRKRVVGRVATSLSRLECGARPQRFQLVLKEFFGLALGLEVNHCGWIYLFLTILQRLPRGAKPQLLHSARRVGKKFFISLAPTLNVLQYCCYQSRRIELQNLQPQPAVTSWLLEVLEVKASMVEGTFVQSPVCRFL